MRPQPVGLQWKLLFWDLLSPTSGCAACQGPVRFQDEDRGGQAGADGQQAQPAEAAAPGEPEQPVSRLDRLVNFMPVVCCKVCSATFGMHVVLLPLCLPAITHVAGCVRVHTVSEAQQPVMASHVVAESC